MTGFQLEWVRLFDGMLTKSKRGEHHALCAVCLCDVKVVESGVELFTSILSQKCKPGNCSQRNNAHR